MSPLVDLYSLSRYALERDLVRVDVRLLGNGSGRRLRSASLSDFVEDGLLFRFPEADLKRRCIVHLTPEEVAETAFMLSTATTQSRDHPGEVLVTTGDAGVVKSMVVKTALA